MIYHDLAAVESFDILAQPSLALVNKQTRAECLPILYAESMLTMTVALGDWYNDEPGEDPHGRLASMIERSRRGTGGGGLSSYLKLIRAVDVVFTVPLENPGPSDSIHSHLRGEDSNPGPFDSIHFHLRSEDSNYRFDGNEIGTNYNVNHFDWTNDGRVSDLLNEKLENQLGGWDDSTLGTDVFFWWALNCIATVLVLFGNGCPQAMDYVGLECDSFVDDWCIPRR